MQAYINSMSLISPQLTFDGSFLEHPVVHTTEPSLLCIEPSYKELINSVQLRRMSRILKMGLGASSICMNNLPESKIDAIIVGTGLACISDLEKFLVFVLDGNESSLSPIPFINSSHNTVAGQIAMMKKITGYNNTYCHRGSSFEYALQDALMLLQENDASNILVGGIDEYSDNYFKIFGLLNLWRKDPVDNLKLFEGSYSGTILGEGAGFFLLGKTPCNNTYARLVGTYSFLNPESNIEVETILTSFLIKYNKNIVDIDVVILGRNGDNIADVIYNHLEQNFISENSDLVYYKHLCGEYMTSSAFAMWLASNILKCQYIPSDISFRKTKTKRSLKNILIYNHYQNINHSLLLLEAL